MKKRKDEVIPQEFQNSGQSNRQFKKSIHFNCITVHDLSLLKWQRTKLAYCKEVKFEKNIAPTNSSKRFNYKFLRNLVALELYGSLYQTLSYPISKIKTLRTLNVQLPKDLRITRWRKISRNINLKSLSVDFIELISPERITKIIRDTQASNLECFKILKVDVLSEEEERIVADYINKLPKLRCLRAPEEIFSLIDCTKLLRIGMETENLKFFSKLQQKQISNVVNINYLKALEVIYTGATYDCIPLQKFLAKVQLTSFSFSGELTRDTDALVLGLAYQRDLRYLSLDMFFTRNNEMNYSKIFENLENLKEFKIKGRNSFYDRLKDILKPLIGLRTLRIDIPLDLKSEVAVDLAETLRTLQNLQVFHFIFQRDVNYQTTFDYCVEMFKGLTALPKLEEISFESRNNGFDIFSPSNSRLLSRFLSNMGNLRYIRITSFDTNHSYFGLSDILEQLNKLKALKYVKVFTRKVSAPPFTRRDDAFELLYELEYRLNYFDIREVIQSKFMEWFTRRSQFRAEPLHYMTELDQFEGKADPVIPAVDVPGLLAMNNVF